IFTVLSLKHFFEFVEEAAGGRAGFFGFEAGEFLEQFALLAAQVLRGFDVELDVEIANILTAQHRHALALEANALARLGAGRHLQLGPGIVERGNLELAAQRSRGHGDRHTRVKVCTVALEEAMRLDGNEDVEIARRTAAHTGLALIGQANTGAVLNALGDIDRELTVLLAAALATTIGAGLVHHLATALTDRAGAFNGEKALGGAHLAMAIALPAGMGASAGLGTGAFAGIAADERGDVDFDRAALKALFERDFEIVAQIRAAQF